MAFLDELASGALGLAATPPAHWTMTAHGEASAAFVDRERHTGWWLYFFRDLHLDLDPAHDALLARDVARHARLLFDTLFAQSTDRKLPAPRTADASWSPVIEVERDELGLGVLHRMQYEPGRESVMGHTLVPVEQGLFEARWFCREPAATGYREVAAVLKSGKDGLLPQQAYDDPALDEPFPHHPLSRARAAKLWPEEAGLRVIAPAPAAPGGDVTLATGCTIAAPPRFRLQRSLDLLARVSFSGTDGIDRLVVSRGKEPLRAAGLVQLAADQSRSLYERSGLVNVTCEAGPDGDGVLVVTEGDASVPGVGRTRAVARWFVDDEGVVWSICIATTVAVPLDELRDDVAAVARSWRRV
jgi:hypothetical protein